MIGLGKGEICWAASDFAYIATWYNCTPLVVVHVRYLGDPLCVGK